MALIIDIETTSWFKDEDHKRVTIEERRNKTITKDKDKMLANEKDIIRKAALSPYTGQVTVVGFRNTDEKQSLFLTNRYVDPLDNYILALQDEKLLLHSVWDYITKAIEDGVRIVGFGSKDFDIPFLFIRSLVNNIEVDVNYMNLIHPYTHNLHLDIKSLFDKGSLREIAFALDSMTDNTTDGSELPELWHTDPARVVEKCSSDLIQTEKIYERVKRWIPQKLQMY